MSSFEVFSFWFGIVAICLGELSIAMISNKKKSSDEFTSFPQGWASRYVNYSEKEFTELNMDQLTTFWIEDGTDASFEEWYDKVKLARENNKEVLPYNYQKIQGSFTTMVQPGLREMLQPSDLYNTHFRHSLKHRDDIS